MRGHGGAACGAGPSTGQGWERDAQACPPAQRAPLPAIHATGCLGEGKRPMSEDHTSGCILQSKHILDLAQGPQQIWGDGCRFRDRTSPQGALVGSEASPHSVHCCLAFPRFLPGCLGYEGCSQGGMLEAPSPPHRVQNQDPLSSPGPSRVCCERQLQLPFPK